MRAVAITAAKDGPTTMGAPSGKATPLEETLFPVSAAGYALGLNSNFVVIGAAAPGRWIRTPIE
jgi:hypothetical protein